MPLFSGTIQKIPDAKRHRGVQRVEKTCHCEPVLHSDALRAAFGGCALHAACGPCVVAIPRFFEHSLFKTATFPSYLGDRHTSLRAGSRWPLILGTFLTVWLGRSKERPNTFTIPQPTGKSQEAWMESVFFLCFQQRQMYLFVKHSDLKSEIFCAILKTQRETPIYRKTKRQVILN